MSSVHVQVLRKARELISDPARWTQGAYARDESGFEVSSTWEAACCWCALGAIIKTAREMKARVGVTTDVISTLYRHSAGRPVFEVNDKEGHAAVLALFDKALAEEPAP